MSMSVWFGPHFNASDSLYGPSASSTSDKECFYAPISSEIPDSLVLTRTAMRIKNMTKHSKNAARLPSGDPIVEVDDVDVIPDTYDEIVSVHSQSLHHCLRPTPSISACNLVEEIDDIEPTQSAHELGHPIDVAGLIEMHSALENPLSLEDTNTSTSEVSLAETMPLITRPTTAGKCSLDSRDENANPSPPRRSISDSALYIFKRDVDKLRRQQKKYTRKLKRITDKLAVFEHVISNV